MPNLSPAQRAALAALDDDLAVLRAWRGDLDALLTRISNAAVGGDHLAATLQIAGVPRSPALSGALSAHHHHQTARDRAAKASESLTNAIDRLARLRDQIAQ